MAQHREKVTVISAEKMALLAEKGLKAARLTDNEMIALASGGLKELYAIKKSLTTSTSPIGQQSIDHAVDLYYSATEKKTPAQSLADIIVRLTNNALNIVAETAGWQLNSPAFARRGSDVNAVSVYKQAGKRTVHLEISKSPDNRASINVRLTTTSKKECTSFEAALFRNEVCIESVHVAKNPVAAFTGIASGDYVVKVFGKKGEISSVSIRLKE